LTFDYISQLKTKENSFFCVNGLAEFLPFRDNCFDYVVSSYLPKYSNLISLVSECYRILKKGGVVVLHDFIYPTRSIFQHLWKIYFKLLKLSSNFLKNWSNVFNELDTLIMRSDWYVTLPKILLEKGFEQITSETLTFETSAIVCAKKQ
jgi:demethylmenaquinone methyltransferase/2-methoxy-6-polyprenyl-1,4-benzoquinol methylase